MLLVESKVNVSGLKHCKKNKIISYLCLVWFSSKTVRSGTVFVNVQLY